MIKILIAVIVVIIMLLVNKMCMKKNKYFFPIIPFKMIDLLNAKGSRRVNSC